MDVWIEQHIDDARMILEDMVLLVDESYEVRVGRDSYLFYGSPWTPAFVG